MLSSKVAVVEYKERLPWSQTGLSRLALLSTRKLIPFLFGRMEIIGLSQVAIKIK